MDFDEYLDDLADGSKQLKVSDLQRLSRLPDAQADGLRNRWPGIDVRRRRRLVQELTELAEDNVDLDFDTVFLRATEDEDSEVRLESLRGLWENESPQFLARLVEILEKDPDPGVRAEAALAIGRFVLLAELGRLRERHFEKAAAALRGVVEDPNENDDVRARAIEAIGAHDEAWVRQAIQQAYESGDRRMKVSAVHAMGRSAEPRWLPLVTRELSSDEAELRYEAAVAAGAIGDETAVMQLVPLVEDDDSEVRQAAIAALGEIGGNQAKNALLEMLDSSSSATREAAAEALAEIDFEEDPLGFRNRG
jgi:HEAT repeat protein